VEAINFSSHVQSWSWCWINVLFPDPRQSFSHSRMIKSRNDSILVKFEHPDQSGLFGRNLPSQTRHEYYFLTDISPSLHGDLFTRAQQLLAKLIRQVDAFIYFQNERTVGKICRAKVRMALHFCKSWERLYFRKCNSNKMKSCQTNNTSTFLNFKTLDVMDFCMRLYKGHLFFALLLGQSKLHFMLTMSRHTSEQF